MPHILLVEDNKHMSRIYTEKLRHEGFEVELAENGEQGILMARSCAPDAILLDIMLPKLSGFEVLEQLREHPELSQIPVFMLSNRAWPDDIQRSLALGARHFYTKGLDSLKEITANIRAECKLKKVIAITASAEHVKQIGDLIHHPQLLVSFSTVPAETVSLCENGSPELILLDGRPPFLNAIPMLQQIKARASIRNIPMFAITDQPAAMQRADLALTPAEMNYRLRPAVLERLGMQENAIVR